MSSASFALQQAVFTALSDDSALAALLGESRIFDDVPQGTPLPYLAFGPMTERDWSAGGDPGTDEGREHTLTLHVWSDARGKKQAHEVLAAVRAVLHNAPLSLAGHRLVNLRHELSETRRTPDGESIHGLARFRAVTEPA